MKTLRYSTRRAVPVDCLRLNEDIKAIESAIWHLKTIDPYNTSDEPHRDELWLCIQKLQGLLRHSRRKMQIEFLDPRRTER